MALDGVLSDLESIGYTAGAVVIPAGAVNALHRRDRVWILAHRDGCDARQQITAQGGAPPTVSRECSTSASIPDTVQEPDGIQRRGLRSEPARFCASMADANGAGQQEQCWTEPVQPEHTATEHSGGNRAGAEATWPLDTRPDGLSPGLVRSGWRNGTWESDLSRVTIDEPQRRQKLQAAGNAIVPQVAYEILRVMIGVANDHE